MTLCRRRSPVWRPLVTGVIAAMVVSCNHAGPGEFGASGSQALSSWKIGLYTTSEPLFVSEEQKLGNARLQLYLSYAFYDQNDIGAQASWANSKDITLVVAFEPKPEGYTSAQQRKYALDRVAAGDFDSYYRSLADQLAAVGREVWLRYASEMNLEANDAPWAYSDTAGHVLPGNGPANFKKAWRHVHEVVSAEITAQGGDPTLVKWVIAPGASNWPDVSPNKIGNYYPGSDVVDILGMDGYNSGTGSGGTGWRSFQTVFGSGYAALAALDPDKPIMLAEFGCDPNGGDRAAWIQHAANAMVQDYPRISAFIWYDLDHWRLLDSDGSYSAFATYFVHRGAYGPDGGSAEDAGDPLGDGPSDGGSPPASSNSCNTDTDCNNGLTGTETICVSNTCMAGCHMNSDCTPGTVCDQSLSLPSCVVPDAGPTSTVGLPCQTDADCGGDQQLYCSSGICTQACGQDSDCPSGEVCDMTLPVPTCDSGSTVSDAGTGGCTQDTDCNGGMPGTVTVCLNGACVGGCHSNSDCPAGACDTSTDPGSCQGFDAGTSGGCTQDSDCNNGATGTITVCSNGACVGGCHQDPDCPPGDTCDTSTDPGSCQAVDAGSSGGCSSDVDCNSGATGTITVCESGACVGGCHQNSDCPDGEQCDTSSSPGTCQGVDAGTAGGCTNDSQCNGGMTGTGMVCSDTGGSAGMCIQGCHLDSDCSGYTTCDKSVEPWQCDSVNQSCSSDSDCNGGQGGTGIVCANSGPNAGTCIMGCHTNSDCPSGTTCDQSLPTWMCD